MKKIGLYTIFYLLCFTVGPQAFAQSGWNWGADPGRAKQLHENFKSALDTENFELAAEQLEKVIKLTPDLNKSVYQHGEKIYRKLAEDADTRLDRLAHEDRVLALYELRIKYFGEEAYVLSRKGYRAYEYLSRRKNEPALLDTLEVLFARIVRLNGSQTPRTLLIYYADAVCKNSRRKNGSADNVLPHYEALAAVIDTMLQTGTDREKWMAVQDAADKIMLNNCLPADCDFSRRYLGPKLKAQPGNLSAARQIVNFMLKGKCSSDPLFLQAAQVLYDSLQTPDLALLIGKIRMGKKEWKPAEKMLLTAAEKFDKPERKADALLTVAKLRSQTERPAEARDAALKAAEIYTGCRGEAWNFCAGLYMSAAGDCRGTNPAEARFCFLAAYDMYEKARDKEGMKAAKAQFPSRTDIFSYMNDDFEKEISVGCWIGGKTVLRARPDNK